MRSGVVLVNFVLYTILTLFLFACMRAEGQRTGLMPGPVEGYISDGASEAGPKYVFTFPTTVNTGELLIACAGGDSGATPFTVTSVPAETWSSASVTSVSSIKVQLWYTVATSTASYALKLAFTGGQTAAIAGAHYKNISGTLDGSIATATASGSPATIATTQTTATNNDLLVSCLVPEGGGTGSLVQSATSFVAFDASSNRSYHSYQNGTAAGSQTVTFKNASQTLGGTGLAANLAMQTAAFKPSGIFLADTLLPDALSGVAYEAQLHCIGGTAAQTYSLFSGSLPTGLSLNTATGEITGTVSGTTQTVGFRCTDGTLTSATDSLTLTVGTVFNSPSFRQQKMALNATGATTLNSPVQCGSVLGVVMHGINTHGGEGYLANDSGTNDNVTDGVGNVLHRITLNGGNTVAPLTVYVTDPIHYSGTATININKTGIGSPLMSTFFEVAGAQAPMSPATYVSVNGPTVPSTVTAAGSYTSRVPNELVVGVTVSSSDQDTYAAAAPFSLLAQGGVTCQVGYDCLAISDTSLVAASSTTLTTTVTTPAQYDNTSQILFGLRPALSATGCLAPPSGPQGEKYRRQVW